MKTPRLSRALVLQKSVHIPDNAGGHTETWEDLGQIWAEVIAGMGRDLAGEEVRLTSVPYRISVRATPPGHPIHPCAGQRFREDGRTFLIKAVTERDASGLYLICFCREEAPV